jgi:hypothetical protein
MDTEKLDALIAAVEAGTWVDMEPAYVLLGVKAIIAARAYKSSLDAAHALHLVLLPGWYGKTDTEGKAYVSDYAKELFDAHVAGNPARAWLLAILKAYRAQVTA